MCTERFYNVCYKDIFRRDVFLTLKLSVGEVAQWLFAIQTDTQIVLGSPYKRCSDLEIFHKQLSGPRRNTIMLVCVGFFCGHIYAVQKHTNESKIARHVSFRWINRVDGHLPVGRMFVRL